ncbi:MAG: response regulator [Nitrospiraceae bacterium]
MANVLIADDEPMVIHLLKTILTRLGYKVLVADGGEAALKVFTKYRPEAIILDLNMPGMSGIEVLRRIRAVDRHVPVIVWSGAGTETLERKAQKLGVTEFLKKGFSLHELGQAMNRVCEAYEAHQTETPGKRIAL